LRSASAFQELQTIAGFFEENTGENEPFWIAPPGLLLKLIFLSLIPRRFHFDEGR